MKKKESIRYRVGSVGNTSVIKYKLPIGSKVLLLKETPFTHESMADLRKRAHKFVTKKTVYYMHSEIWARILEWSLVTLPFNESDYRVIMIQTKDLQHVYD